MEMPITLTLDKMLMAGYGQLQSHIGGSTVQWDRDGEGCIGALTLAEEPGSEHQF